MWSIFATLLLVTGSVRANWYDRSAKNGIVEELGAKLSQGARIVLKGEEGFKEQTKRWQAWSSPHISAVVDVRSEEDVQQAIRYASRNSIPFLALSGTHGSTSSLSTAHHALQIDLRALSSFSISPDGHSITAHAKQAVTGACECVGLTAVALGGGHGFLQGYYGLLSDQIMSMRVVLANSSLITVSEEEHEELFWAMRGAGHNFGIVTEMQYKIHDVGDKQTWSWEAFTLPATAENVRLVYGIAQEQLNTQPEGMMQYGLVLINPTVFDGPIILHNVAYNGPLEGIKQYTQAYHDLKPLKYDSEQGTYLDVARWMQIDEKGLVCSLQDFMPGAGVMRFPVDVQAYNLTALALTVQKFVDLTTAGPEFAGSFMMIEQYSSHAVRSADATKSVYASREDKLLLAPALLYASVNAETDERNEELDAKARAYGEEMRQLLIDGAKDMGGSHSYVNYANGGESLDEVYGKDEVKRLLKLKDKYDPRNRFGFYAPLKPAEKEEHGSHSEL
ncbi:hypothetical protein N0V90_003727 [Kalmusia sp. IMI 367209]|nr:hypothetical protein N0V90_003727 [Kalmusia sp. IMI 367209]